MALDYWHKLSTRRKRVFAILSFFLLSVIITIAGVLTPLTASEVTTREEDLKQLRENVSLQYIFGNNLVICLVMFVPVIGPILGLSILYNTGVYVAADSNANNVSPLLAFAFLFIFPFTWLEFLAYSIAFAESVWLTWRVVQRKGKSELMAASKFVLIVNVALLLAAIIETAIIASI